MQTIGHIFDVATNEKILVLVRQGSSGFYLKRRKSGKDGQHLVSEEYFLNEPEQKSRFEKLKNGEVVFC